MLIDTHCHLNIMIKQAPDRLLSERELIECDRLLAEAREHQVTTIINVGTTVIESQNSIALATRFNTVYATIGIHPNDCTEAWRSEVQQLHTLLKETAPGIIVGIGECGIDKHYPGYHLAQQKDVFRAQIELALTHNLALVVHTRNAAEETLNCLQEYKQHPIRGTIHCFSEGIDFAKEVIALGFVVGLGGTITYPKNEALRHVACTVNLTDIVLETDAPYLPLQPMRGKRNHPQYIADIALYLAQLRTTTFEDVAQQTTLNALKLFQIS